MSTPLVYTGAHVSDRQVLVSLVTVLLNSIVNACMLSIGNFTVSVVLGPLLIVRTTSLI